MSSSEERVEVVLRNTDPHDDHELHVTVNVSATLEQVLVAASRRMMRPGLTKKCKFVRSLANGKFAPIKHEQPLGDRRVLLLDGDRIGTPPPEEQCRATVSSGAFDDLSCPEFMVLETPRSIDACKLEGIDPEDLVYAPLKTFQDEYDVPGHVAQLRHDFFEELRQEFLFSVRRTRDRLQQEEQASSILPHEQSRDVESSVAVYSGLASSSQETFTSAGGIFSGEMATSEYPRMESFFISQRRLVERERENKVREKSGELQGMFNGCFFNNPGGQGRYGHADVLVGEGPEFPLRLTKAERTAEEESRKPSNVPGSADLAAKRMNRDCNYLQSMPGAKHETPNERHLRCEDQILKTKSVLVVQRRKNSVQMQDMHYEGERLLSSKCAIENKKIYTRDKEMAYTEWLSDFKEEQHEANKGHLGLAQRKGRISAGRDMLKMKLSLDAAKKKAMTMAGCKGFCFKPKNVMYPETEVEVTFKDKWQLDESDEAWTSFELCRDFHSGKANLVGHPKNGVAGLSLKDRKDYHKYIRTCNHEKQVENERERVKLRQPMLDKVHKKATLVHEINDNVKVRYGKEWAERRINFIENNHNVSKLQKEWQRGTTDRHDFVEACREMESHRQLKVQVYKQELKRLRGLFNEMIRQRQQRRERCRKQAVGKELARMVAEAKSLEKSGPLGTALSGSLFSTTESWRPKSSLHPVSFTRPRSVPRFDFPNTRLDNPTNTLATLSQSSSTMSRDMDSRSKSQLLRASCSSPLLSGGLSMLSH